MNTIEKLDVVSMVRYAERTRDSVSGRYRTIDTQSLVTQVIGDLGIGATIESVSGRGSKSTKHAVVLTLEQPVLLAGTKCYPRIYVCNSYAGESALTVRVGFYRLICSNGMMVGTTHFNGRIVHLESGVRQIPLLRESIVAAMQWCTVELPKLADRLNGTVLTANQIEAVLTAIGASKRLVERVQWQVRYPTINVRPEDRQSDGQLTAWNVWNLVNEIQRRGSRSQLRQLDVNAKLLDAVEHVTKLAA